MEKHKNDDKRPQGSHPIAAAFFKALDTGASSARQSESLKRTAMSVGWRNRHSQDERYPIQVGDSSFSVKQVQRGEIEGTYGTGATVWPAAVVLVKYLEKNPSIIKAKSVVDLGAGTAITSIAAALLGASEVCCTDGEGNVVKLAAENVDAAARELPDSHPRNESSEARVRGCPIVVQKHWWGEDKIEACPEVVLVADCVLPKLYPIAPLVQAIDDLLRSPSAIAVLSYEHRHFQSYDPRDKFKELCGHRGLSVKVIDRLEHDDVYSVEDIEIWHVERSPI